MSDYKKLSIRYLKMNKKRTILTIAGVSVTVIVLFVMLNLGWSWVLNYREKIREEKDYEIVLFTESRSKIEQIIADDRVREAEVGSYYYRDYDKEKNRLYPNALYINTNNPYRMDAIFQALKTDYGVEGEENDMLAVTYFNGGTDNAFMILVLFLLLISYIFAIFGVGIIRNSVQLSTMEQIKDYGNLRCIGASKGQLSSFIYLEGAIMEVSGMIIGILIGTGISIIAGYFLKINAGFHFVPIVPIAIAFLGDLFFAMKENCKLVVNMTPISAVRGEFRIRKETIKVRGSGIFGKLFGVEGDYAYKNVMRNPGRFYKTVFAMGIGIAALITGGGIGENIKEAIDFTSEQYKYYQMYFEVESNPWNTAEEIQANLPPMENLEGLAKAKGVTATKRLYSSGVMLAQDSIFNHYTQQFATETESGAGGPIMLDYLEQKKNDEKSFNMVNLIAKRVVCKGYDEEDYARYEKVLEDGTLDISEHGLVLLNGGTVVKSQEDTKSLNMEYVNTTMTDYKVGDTVQIVDIKKLRENTAKRIAEMKKQKQDEKKNATGGRTDSTQENGFVDEDDKAMETAMDETEYQGDLDIHDIVSECLQELIEEGAYETYTIEGIVKDDVNHIVEEPCFILPLDHYYALTGLSENENNGMQYHIDQYPENDNLNEYTYYDFEATDLFCDNSFYAEVMEIMKRAKRTIYVGTLFVVFIVSISAVNIINTTASNIHLRRKELAQLRVIGVSKKRLIRIVLLEGVITAIVANIAGFILGTGVGYLLSWFIYMVSGVKYRIPLLSALLSIVLSLTLLCGSIYFPLKGLKQDIATDLAASGE